MDGRCVGDTVARLGGLVGRRVGAGVGARLGEYDGRRDVGARVRKPMTTRLDGAVVGSKDGADVALVGARVTYGWAL